MLRLIFILSVFVCVFAQKEQEFTTWLVDNGAQFDNCDIGVSGDPNVGVVATSEIEATMSTSNQDTRVTYHLLAFSAPVIGPILRENSDILSSTATLAVFLTYERKKPNSFWKPYFNMLPRRLNTPMFWSEADQKLLEGSWILDRSLADKAGITEDYNYIFPIFFQKYPKVFNSKDHTVDDYLWAWGIIWDKSFYFESTGNALVPLLDLVQHKDDSNGELNFENHFFSLTINDDYEENEPIYFNRGSRSNSDLVRLHGYMMSSNSRGIVYYNISLNDNDPYLQMKKALLNKEGLLSSPYPYSDAPDGLFISNRGIPKHVVAFYRVKVWNPSVSQVQDYNKDGTLPAWNPLVELNKANEEDALEQIVLDLEEALERYPDSFKEDQKLMKEPNLPSTQKLAIKIRYEEKMILNKQRNAILYPQDFNSKNIL